jgi:hypothetical protein
MDPADWLAAAATRTLPRRPPPRELVLAPAPLERRLIALMIDGALMAFGGGVAAVILTYGVLAPLLGAGDFDGPPAYNALGEWLFLVTWSGVILAYAAVEAFGRRTLGKAAAGLHLFAPPGHARRRLLLRWLLAYSPLLVLLLLCAAGAAHAASIGWDPFEDPIPGLDFAPVVVGPLIVLWLFGFGWAGRSRKQTLADEVSGVQLLRQMPPPAERPRFEVIAAPRPVLPA